MATAIANGNDEKFVFEFIPKVEGKFDVVLIDDNDREVKMLSDEITEDGVDVVNTIEWDGVMDDDKIEIIY